SRKGVIRVSGTKRPPKSPKYPRESGHRAWVSTFVHCIHELLDLLMVFNSRLDFDSCRCINGKRFYQTDRVSNVIWSQAAGQHEPSPDGIGFSFQDVIEQLPI